MKYSARFILLRNYTLSAHDYASFSVRTQATFTSGGPPNVVASGLPPVGYWTTGCEGRLYIALKMFSWMRPVFDVNAPIIRMVIYYLACLYTIPVQFFKLAHLVYLFGGFGHSYINGVYKCKKDPLSSLLKLLGKNYLLVFSHGTDSEKKT